MDLNSFIQNFKAEMCTSEKIALQSMHDFFTSSSEKYYDYVQVIQECISNDSLTEEEINEILRAKGIEANQDAIISIGQGTESLRNLIHHIAQESNNMEEEELTFQSIDGGSYTIDDAMIGINDTINANIALAEGTQALANATADTLANQATNFFQNLNLRVNDISGAVSETAYSLNALLQDTNLPWRDKFRYIMDISGISKLLNPSTSDEDALNFSDSFSAQMTGTSPLKQTVTAVVENFDELPTIQQVGAAIKTAAYYIWVKPFELWWTGVTWVGNKVADTAKVAYNPNDVAENDRFDDQTIDNLGMGFRISFRSIGYVSDDKIQKFKDKLKTDEYICLSLNPATLYVWKQDEDYFNLLIKIHPVAPWAQTSLHNILEELDEQLQGAPLNEEHYNYLGNLFGQINYQANNFSSANENDVLRGIQAAKQLLAQNAMNFFVIHKWNEVNRMMWEGVFNPVYHRSIPSTVTNLTLAQEMTTWGSGTYDKYQMTDGAMPVLIDEQYGLNFDERSRESFLTTLIYYVIEGITSDTQYCPYIRINSQLKGRLSIKTDQENYDAFNKLLIGIAIVAAVVAVAIVTGKVITGMRKSAIKAATNLASYKQRMNLRVMKGRPLTDENIDTLYKLTKKSNFLSKLTKGFCSSTSDVLSTSLLSMDSFSSSSSKGISSITKTVNESSSEIMEDNKTIIKLISGE